MEQLNGTGSSWRNIPAESAWDKSVDGSKAFPTLQGSQRTEVLIVGGGIAGILTAWMLKQAGVPCIVAEAKNICGGVTRNTTAKITAQHGLIYADLIDREGLDKAQLFYRANTRVIEDFRQLATEYPCDYEAQTAYVYSTDNRETLEREANAYQKLGIPAWLLGDASLPFPTVGALAMEGQAQFNPMKLLTALAMGLPIYENTFIHTIEDGKAIAKCGTIEAKHIVLATHYPMVNIPGLYFLKLYQHRSYVLALEGAPLPDGMYVDEKQGGQSFRTYGNLLLLGGGSHKTGAQSGGYQDLENMAKKYYPEARLKYRWATQDCMSLDSVPYVGRHHRGKENLYVATGFNKWGMTGSMVAAGLLCDLIVSGKSELEELYSPQRSMVSKQLAVNIGSAAMNLLTPGGPRCTHMGCKLKGNCEEGTIDCPCHGSRYDEAGHVINNPAKRGLRLK